MFEADFCVAVDTEGNFEGLVAVLLFFFFFFVVFSLSLGSLGGCGWVLLAMAANWAMVLSAPSSEWNSREWRDRGGRVAGGTISALKSAERPGGTGCIVVCLRLCAVLY